jgi:hypothetical protein
MNTEQQAFLKSLQEQRSGEYISKVQDRYDLTWLKAQQLVTQWVQQGCRG